MKNASIYQLALVFISLWIGVLLIPISAAAQQVSVELNPASIGLDQSATLRVSVDGSQSADITIPEVDGLVFHPAGTSSQIQIVNGSISSSVVHSYVIQAQKTGSYTIGPIQVATGGAEQQTEPLSLTVAPAGSGTGGGGGQPGRSAEPSSAEQNTSFITLSPQKTQAYLGEVVPVEIKLYFRKGIRVNQVSLPKFADDGTLLDPLDSDPLQTEETVSGIRYNVLSWDTFITGVKEGPHQLSVAVDATQLVPSRRSSPLSGFGSNFYNDDLFNNLFSNYSSRPVQVTSPAVDFEVRPLPETGRPEGFSGAVGRFELQVQASPLTVQFGEPITLVMRVTGSGNFDNVQAPAISETSGIKSYSPSAAFNRDQHLHHGEKRFEQAIILTDPGLKQIPPIIFSYFDPDEGRYRTLFSDPIELSLHSPVQASVTPSAPAPDTPSVAAETQPEDDRAAATQQIALAPVKLVEDKTVASIRPPFLRPWFIASLLFLLCASAGLSGYRLYQIRISNRPEYLQRRALAQLRKETLKALNRLDIGHESYPLKARATLLPFLSTLLKSQATGLSTADVAEKTGTSSGAAALFRCCDQVQYGGVQLSEDERKKLHRLLIDYVAGGS